MKALWLENQSLSYRADARSPEPPAGEALVRVRLAGICATDLELVRGYYPFTGIPGHEFVGEIVRSPGFPNREGQRVVGEINAVCGKCDLCLAGNETHCKQRTVLGISGRNGAFAEYLSLPIKNLHPIPREIPDEKAVFTEPLAAALEILEQIHIRPSEQVLLVGAGRLGQLIAQVVALTGCNLQVIARHTHQKEILSANKIATLPENEVPDRKFDLVIEATGSPGGFELARRAVRPRGRLVLKSTYKGDIQINISAAVVDEITFIGSRCGPFPPALRLLASGRVDPTPLIEDRLPLSDGKMAFDLADKKGALKILLQP